MTRQTPEKISIKKESQKSRSTRPNQVPSSKLGQIDLSNQDVAVFADKSIERVSIELKESAVVTDLHPTPATYEVQETEVYQPNQDHDSGAEFDDYVNVANINKGFGVR